MLPWVTCTSDDSKKMMSCFNCTSAVMSEHFTFRHRRAQYSKTGKFRQRTVGTLSRKVETFCWMPTSCFFCWVVPKWSPLAFHLYFSFEQNIYSSMGENGFLLRSASVCASPLWSSSHWMEDELRLGNAGTFMHMLTENFGSALRECMSKVFNISPGILHFMSEVLLKFTLLTLLKMFWADHSLW